MDDRPFFTSADSRSRSGHGRVWLALLLMPLVSALAAAAVLPVISSEEPGAAGSGVFAFVAAIAAVFVTVAGEVPMFLTLKRRGPEDAE